MIILVWMEAHITTYNIETQKCKYFPDCLLSRNTASRWRSGSSGMTSDCDMSTLLKANTKQARENKKSCSTFSFIESHEFLNQAFRVIPIKHFLRVEFNFWMLVYLVLTGKLNYLTLTDPTKVSSRCPTWLTLLTSLQVWMPDTFFRNEKEAKKHEIIVPNVYVSQPLLFCTNHFLQERANLCRIL